MAHTSSRPIRSVAAFAGLVLAALLVVLPMSSAHAATYRFWGYWTLKGSTWTFAQDGPAKTHPANGSVQGWRFAVSGPSGSRHPRGVVTFDKVCAGTSPASGKKRVAVVIDYGRTADAQTGTPPRPAAECALVASNATGADALAAVATVRTANGLVCGIDSWPASGCGGAVPHVTAAQKAADTPVAIALPQHAAAQQSSSHGWLIGVIVAVIVIVLAGLLLVTLRRRRSVLES